MRFAPDITRIGALWLPAILWLPHPAYGDTMRCGESLLERGQTFFEVQERCGAPDLNYAWDQRYVPGVEARVTEWVYEQGSNKFRRVLTFEAGRLRDIELRPKPEKSIESTR